MNSLERVASCVAQVEPRLKEMPRMGIVLGSGLGALAEALNDAVVIPYADIEGFPVSTAPGHVGRYLFGRLEDVPVVLMQGRVHLYEGVTVEEAVLPVRVMAALGVEAILLTNAAGAIADAIDVGHFCALKTTLHNLCLRRSSERMWTLGARGFRTCPRSTIPRCGRCSWRPDAKRVV